MKATKTQLTQALRLTLLAMLDLSRQIPNDERLADFNFDLCEIAEQTAKETLKGIVPYDERTERERVTDELINSIDPNTINGAIILSYLKRNRTRQID